jgi:hypothetical protein
MILPVKSDPVMIYSLQESKMERSGELSISSLLARLLSMMVSVIVLAEAVAGVVMRLTSMTVFSTSGDCLVADRVESLLLVVVVSVVVSVFADVLLG